MTGTLPEFNDLLNNVHVGDNVEFMRTLPDKCIDLTVTSPPYDNLRTYNGYSFDFESVASELFRITKPGGVVVWVVGDKTDKGSETLTSFRQALYFKGIGFNVHDTMIYAKKNPMPLTHNRYEQQFEYMFVLAKGKPKTFNPLLRDTKYAGKSRTGTFRQKGAELLPKNTDGEVSKKAQRYNIWEYAVGKGHTTQDNYAFVHSAMFPEQLAQDHIVSWSNPGDVVFDCFAGSGTTLKMALLNDRKYLGVEISDEYVAIAEQRLSDVKSTQQEAE